MSDGRGFDILLNYPRFEAIACDTVVLDEDHRAACTPDPRCEAIDALNNRVEVVLETFSDGGLLHVDDYESVHNPNWRSSSGRFSCRAKHAWRAVRRARRSWASAYHFKGIG